MKARCTLIPLLLLAAGTLPLHAAAGPPFPVSDIPPMVTVAPDGSFGCRMLIMGSQGPVLGALVEVEFSPAATGLVAWTVPVPPGADVPVTGPGGGLMFTGTTDINGEVVFHIAGAGCVAEKAGDVDPYIVQVRADNIVMAEPYINSPDAVDADGVLPEVLGFSICDPAAQTTEVGLSDALFHTPGIKNGLQEICTDFTDDGQPAVGLGDATALTPYVRGGTTASCVYNGP